MSNKENDKLLYTPKNKYRAQHGNFGNEKENNDETTTSDIKEKENKTILNSEKAANKVDKQPENPIDSKKDKTSNENLENSEEKSLLNNKSSKGIISGQGKSVLKKAAINYIKKNPIILISLIVIAFILIIIMGAVGYENTETNDYINYEKEYNLWWPIGGDEINLINGIEFASGPPTSTNVVIEIDRNQFLEIDQGGSVITDEFGHVHYLEVAPGVVIKVGEGKHYIIASFGGEVQVVTELNYGNKEVSYIRITHEDGIALGYANINKESIRVKTGDIVEQGQVLGELYSHEELFFEVEYMEMHVRALNYISADDPRKVSSSLGLGQISMYKTDLTKSEFISYMRQYSEKLYQPRKTHYDNNFLANASLIYDVSVQYNVNPEIVLAFAEIEQGYELCGRWWNFWGIGIYNTNTKCDAGAHYTSMREGIIGFAKIINDYNTPGSWQRNTILERKAEREAAGCDPRGYGEPDTLSGVMSLYGGIGTYLANPGGWSIGGCHYINYWANTNFMPETYTKEYAARRCGNHTLCSSAAYKVSPSCVKATICEQSDFTYFISLARIKVLEAIFG